MKTSRILLGVTVAMLCGVGPAFAALSHNLTVRLSSGGDCLDQTSPCDTNPAPGVVTFQNANGTLTATGSAGPGPFDMNLHYVLLAGDPTFQVSENNFSSGSSLSWTALINGIQNTSATSTTTTNWSFFADASNTLFGTGTLICSGSSTATSIISATCSGPPSAFSGGAFSLTEVITVTNPTASPTASGDASLRAVTASVPEPGTLLLLGSGLVVAGMWRGRRAFRKQEE